MSENVAQKCHDRDGVTKQAVNSSHHSVWMAHWMRSSSCKSTTKPGCNQMSICHNGLDVARDSKRDLSIGGLAQSGNRPEECDNKSSEIADTKLVTFGDEKSKSSFPMFNLQRKGDLESARKDHRASSSHWESIKPQNDHDDSGFQLFSIGEDEKQSKDFPPMIQWVRDTKTPSREKQFKAEYISKNQVEVVGDNSGRDKEKLTKADVVVSSSKVVSYGFNLGTRVRPLCEHEEINKSSSITESRQQVTNNAYHSNSVFLVRDEAVSDPFEKSRPPLATYNYAQLLPRDPSTSRSQQPKFVVKQYQKIQERYDSIGLFPSKNSPMDWTGPKHYHGNSSLPNPLSRNVGVVGTSNVDSVEESSRGHKKFSSSKTHRFLFASTNFDLMEGGCMLKESMVSTKLKEKYAPEPFHFGQDNAFPIKSGVKLQLLGSSTGSEGEKDVEALKTSSVNIRNESSTETNTMDLDTFKNYFSGMVSSSSNKHVELDQQILTPQATLDMGRDFGGTSHKRKLLDINKQPNDVDVHASSVDTSTSRTQSLDAEFLLLDQPTSFKFNTRHASSRDSEPNSRWLKRLKTSPTSACGGINTRNSNKMEEESSGEQVTNIFNKIMKFTMKSSDPDTGSRGKQLAGLSVKTPSDDSVRKDREVTLSHPWIRRLCQKNLARSSDETMKAAPVSESQCLKPLMDEPESKVEPENKQFPSLVAMALMGRALKGYDPCKIKKKGSSVVWSS